MFTPDETADYPGDECPLPLQWIDCVRITHTDLDDPKEREIHDVWANEPDDRTQLSEPWLGISVFEIVRHVLPRGYEWVHESKTRIQK